MTIPEQRDRAKTAIDWLGLVPISELPSECLVDGGINCPTCHVPVLGKELLIASGPVDLFKPTYEEIRKLRSWTVAQLIAWRDLQARSGISIRELLARTSFGGADYVGVDDFHGMFIGIEKDGYSHS